MSKESLQSFLKKVSADKDLMAEIESALKRKKGEGAIEEFVRVGSMQGYEFNTEEASAFFSVENGELNERELENVAGGIDLLRTWDRMRIWF